MSGTHDQSPLNRAASRNRRGAARKSVLALFFLLLFCGGAWAPIFIQLGTPQDSPEVRRAVADREELKRPAEEYRDLIQTRLGGLKLAVVQRIFGPRLEYHPGNLVLPIFVPPGVGMSGARPGGTPDNRHTDRHAVGDIGYADFYYGFDGESVAAVVLWNRADRVALPLGRAFVPLQSENDFRARLEWDRQQFEDIKSWLAEHLAKATTDLGVVEITNYTQIRLHLKTGEDCFVGGGPMPDGDFCASVAAGPHGSSEAGKLFAWNIIRHPNQPVVFSVAGNCYSITPKFSVVDLGTVETAYDVPTRLEVGAGQECMITASRMTFPGGAPHGTSVRFQFHSGEYDPEHQRWAGSWQYQASPRDPAQPVLFPLSDRFYSFTLKLK